MNLEDIISLKVREAVHAALDERESLALPRLYRLSEVEEHYGGTVKAATLRALCKSGVLPYVRLTPEGPYLLTPEGIRVAVERLTTQPDTTHERVLADRKRLSDVK